MKTSFIDKLHESWTSFVAPLAEVAVRLKD